MQDDVFSLAIGCLLQSVYLLTVLKDVNISRRVSKLIWRFTAQGCCEMQHPSVKNIA